MCLNERNKWVYLSLLLIREVYNILIFQDYPFLKEHICPAGGMVVKNGHSVVACKDCYLSLNEQVIVYEFFISLQGYHYIIRFQHLALLL